MKYKQNDAITNKYERNNNNRNVSNGRSYTNCISNDNNIII